jgi:hypothetical protein
LAPRCQDLHDLRRNFRDSKNCDFEGISVVNINL